jgi:exopolysaccharide production protein ExoQ
MNHIGMLVFVLGIIGLIVLDRDRQSETSKALWLPVIWILIAGSRSVAQWLHMTPPASTDLYLEGNPLDRTILTVLMAVALMVLLKRGRQSIAILRSNAPILLFFLYCAISLLWSDYPEVAFKRWFKALGDLMMVMIVLTEPDKLAAVKRLLARTGFVLVPLSVLFIKYYPDLGRTYTGWGSTTNWRPVFVGVATDKNMLGMVCLTIGLGSVWRFLQALREKKFAWRRMLFARGVLLGMVMWLFWISDSVTSMACFLMAAGLMVVTSTPSLARRISVVHLFVAGIIFVSLFGLFFDPTGNLVHAMGRNSTLTDRTGIWKVLLTIPVNPVLGTGFESFWLGDRLNTVWRFYPGVQEAHNGYLEIYLNLGWMGVALLAVILVAGYRNAVTAFHQDPDVGRLRLAYIVIALVYSLTEAGYRSRGLVWIFLLLATIKVPKASVPGSITISEKELAPSRDVDLLVTSTRA